MNISAFCCCPLLGLVDDLLCSVALLLYADCADLTRFVQTCKRVYAACQRASFLVRYREIHDSCVFQMQQNFVLEQITPVCDGEATKNIFAVPCKHITVRFHHVAGMPRTFASFSPIDATTGNKLAFAARCCSLVSVRSLHLPRDDRQERWMLVVQPNPAVREKLLQWELEMSVWCDEQIDAQLTTPIPGSLFSSMLFDLPEQQQEPSYCYIRLSWKAGQVRCWDSQGSPVDEQKIRDPKAVERFLKGDAMHGSCHPSVFSFVATVSGYRQSYGRRGFLLQLNHVKLEDWSFLSKQHLYCLANKEQPRNNHKRKLLMMHPL